MRIPLIALIGVFCGLNSLAQQEMIVPLNGRPELYQLKNKKTAEFRKSATPPDTLELPFFDDFSDYFNEKFDFYYWPDTEKWMDRSTFVNDNLPKDPISIGVVTFDGVDFLGQPYNWLASNAGTDADTLTSVPLKLEGTSGVILSFYYQAGGSSTYVPEEEDVLMLEFLSEDTVWNEVWQTPGLEDDTTFFRAMIPIDLDSYLYDGFQFRFRNYASAHANGDFWHLDYIELDEGRTMADTITNDMSLLDRGESLLKRYSSMPWTHYKQNPDDCMGEGVYIKLRNGYDQDQPIEYFVEVSDYNDNVDFTLNSVNASTILALDVCGSYDQDCSDNIDTVVTDQFSPLGGVSDDSTFFLVKKWLVGTGDQFVSNDTTVFVQEFYNYYAYDDGTAEVSMGLGDLEEPGEIVVKYDVKMQDDLRGVQIYFNPIRWDLTNEYFQIVIYDGDSVPENLIYESDTLIPEYTIQNVFYHFMIEDVVWGANESMFIGWRQFPTSDPELKFTVGLDLGRDNAQNRFINIGGSWYQSSNPGTLMMRPVFGNPYQSDPNFVQEVSTIDFRPYPNPVESMLNIGIDPMQMNVTVEVIDMTGRVVLQPVYESAIDVSALKPGLYLLRVMDQGKTVIGNSRFIKK